MRSIEAKTPMCVHIAGVNILTILKLMIYAVILCTFGVKSSRIFAHNLFLVLFITLMVVGFKRQLLVHLALDLFAVGLPLIFVELISVFEILRQLRRIFIESF